MSETQFHFSPRPNRANEIAWQPWSSEAFERAQRGYGRTRAHLT